MNIKPIKLFAAPINQPREPIDIGDTEPVDYISLEDWCWLLGETLSEALASLQWEGAASFHVNEGNLILTVNLSLVTACSSSEVCYRFEYYLKRLAIAYIKCGVLPPQVLSLSITIDEHQINIDIPGIDCLTSRGRSIKRLSVG